jgi:hypothetical protein
MATAAATTGLLALALAVSLSTSSSSYLQSYDFDFMAEPTLEQVIRDQEFGVRLIA